MNAIAKFRNEEVLNVDFICDEADIPMSAMERAKAKQAAIDSVPEHLLDAPVRAPFAKVGAERTTREKELFRLKIRAALTGDTPELSPALVRERQASPVKPEKKVSGWRSFFGTRLSMTNG